MISYSDFISATIDAKELLTDKKVDQLYNNFNMGHENDGVEISIT